MKKCENKKRFSLNLHNTRHIKSRSRTLPFHSHNSHLLYRRWRDFQMMSLPAQRSQNGNSSVALFTVTMFPRVQQVVVVARLIGEVQILVTVGRGEDALEGLATRQFIFSYDQTADVVGRENVENWLQVLKNLKSFSNY